MNNFDLKQRIFHFEIAKIEKNWLFFLIFWNDYLKNGKFLPLNSQNLKKLKLLLKEWEFLSKKPSLDLEIGKILIFK